MLMCTSDTIRAILRMDPTLDLQSRTRIINAIVKATKPQTSSHDAPLPAPRVIKRAEVAQRFGVSMRAVDKMATDGILPRVTLPKHSRSIGFRESDVNDLINGLPGKPTQVGERMAANRERQMAIRKACVDMIEQYRCITGVALKGPLYDAMRKVAELVGEPIDT